MNVARSGSLHLHPEQEKLLNEISVMLNLLLVGFESRLLELFLT